MRCVICKKECAGKICSEKCRTELADKVRREMEKRNGYKRPLSDRFKRGRQHY